MPVVEALSVPVKKKKKKKKKKKHKKNGDCLKRRFSLAKAGNEKKQGNI